MKKHKLSVHIISQELFLYSLVTYLILIIAETLKEDLVSFFFNLNFLLMLVLLSGLIAILTYNESVDVQRNSPLLLKMTSIVTVLFCTFFMFVATQPLGTLSISITGLGMIIITLFCVLMNLENEGK